MHLTKLLKFFQIRLHAVVVDSAGDFIRLDPNSDTPIRLQDKTGNAIYTNKEKGQVCIVAAKEQVASLPRESKTVQGLKSSEIRGDEQKTIHGNKKTNIVGDSAIGVLANVAGNIGGALQLVIANAPGGIPSPTGNAIDISVTQGNTKIHHLVGDIDLDTLAGGVSIGNLLASVECAITGAINSIATLINRIDGSLIQLGSPTGAIHPLIKTATLMPLWQSQLGVLTTAVASATAGTGTPPGNATAIAALATAISAYANALSGLISVPGTHMSTKVVAE